MCISVNSVLLDRLDVRFTAFIHCEIYDKIIKVQQTELLRKATARQIGLNFLAGLYSTADSCDHWCDYW